MSTPRLNLNLIKRRVEPVEPDENLIMRPVGKFVRMQNKKTLVINCTTAVPGIILYRKDKNIPW